MLNSSNIAMYYSIPPRQIRIIILVFFMRWKVPLLFNNINYCQSSTEVILVMWNEKSTENNSVLVFNFCTKIRIPLHTTKTKSTVLQTL